MHITRTERWKYLVALPHTYVLLTALSLPRHSVFSCGVHSKVDDDIDAVVREVNQQFGAASLQTANSECISWSMFLHPCISTI